MTCQRHWEGNLEKWTKTVKNWPLVARKKKPDDFNLDNS